MPLFDPGIAIRLPLYIVLGIVCEFLFTAVCDLVNPSFLKSWNVWQRQAVALRTPSAKAPLWRLPGRDPRAVGYSFLWMIPIYGLLIFIEPMRVVLAPLPFYGRGVIYVIALWIVEYVGGWFIKKISGRCPWDYSASKFNLHGYLRWDFFPFWFVFTLLVEWLSGKFIALTPAIKAVSAWRL